MLAVDFFHADCAVTLKRICVFFTVEVRSRYVHILATTSHPTGGWTSQQARNLLVDLSINVECAYHLRKSGLMPACHNDRFSSVSFSRGG